jgi:hypothetical protein
MSQYDAATIKGLNNKLARVREQIAKLETKLAGYTSFEGEFSEADGTSWNENARKRAEVRAAKRLARQERRQFIRSNRQARIKELIEQKKGTMPYWKARMEARKQARAENPFKVTQVEAGLNAEFSPNKIEVPAQDTATSTASSFDGTGLIGLDSYRDYDAPPVRNVELNFSNASGSRKIDWKSIAIGVGVTVLGIVVYNKFIKK